LSLVTSAVRISLGVGEPEGGGITPPWRWTKQNRNCVKALKGHKRFRTAISAVERGRSQPKKSVKTEKMHTGLGTKTGKGLKSVPLQGQRPKVSAQVSGNYTTGKVPKREWRNSTPSTSTSFPVRPTSERRWGGKPGQGTRRVRNSNEM